MGNKCQVFNLQLNNMQASSASHKHSPRIITQTHTYTHTCKPPVMETTMFWLWRRSTNLCSTLTMMGAKRSRLTPLGCRMGGAWLWGGCAVTRACVNMWVRVFACLCVFKTCVCGLFDACDLHCLCVYLVCVVCDLVEWGSSSKK
jgi:hypothetical protein